VEENIEETLSFYRLPREHHKHLKSTNMLERINQELKRRTHVIRIFESFLMRRAACGSFGRWPEPLAPQMTSLVTVRFPEPSLYHTLEGR
jgi:Transposase, Mutator family